MIRPEGPNTLTLRSRRGTTNVEPTCAVRRQLPLPLTCKCFSHASKLGGSEVGSNVGLGSALPVIQPLNVLRERVIDRFIDSGLFPLEPQLDGLGLGGRVTNDQCISATVLPEAGQYRVVKRNPESDIKRARMRNHLG